MFWDTHRSGHQFWDFSEITSRLLHDWRIELKISGYTSHFRAFQLELDNLGTKNFEIDSEVLVDF